MVKCCLPSAVSLFTTERVCSCIQLLKVENGYFVGKVELGNCPEGGSRLTRVQGQRANLAAGLSGSTLALEANGATNPGVWEQMFPRALEELP